MIKKFNITAEKERILGRLKELPLERLQKLERISESILTPMETELIAMDYAGMLDRVFKQGGLADQFFPEWTDRSSSDFGRFLVELFALFSDKDIFYMNHYSKESFLGVAEEYRSIHHKAINQGFNPPSNTSAVGDVELFFNAGTREVVPRGSITLGVSVLPDLTYVNEEFTIPDSTIDTSITVRFIHGKIDNFSGQFDGHSIFLNTKSISYKSIRLFIDNVEWEEVDSFIEGKYNTKHFMVVYDAEGRAEILFAKDGLGMRPEKGQIFEVEFIVGGGYIGDIDKNTIDLVLSNSTRRNLLSYNQFKFSGGNDIMPLELLRQTVIGKQRHQNRIVTPEDAEYICKEASFVKKVKAEATLGYIYLYILPDGGGSLSPSQISTIKELVNSDDDNKRKLLLGYNCFIGSPIYTPIKLVVDLYLGAGVIKGGAEIKTRQAIQEYLDPQKDGEFGQQISRSTLMSKILQKVAGSTNVIFPTMHRKGQVGNQTSEDIDLIGREVVDWKNSDITINVYGGL